VSNHMHAEVDYSGSIGENLYDIANINLPGAADVYGGVPCTFGDCFDRLNQQYSNVNFRGAAGHSTYNSMNFRYDIQDISRTGLTLRLNYTWSHAIDDLSDTFSSSFNQFNLGYTDPYDPSFDKGDAEFDNRQRVAISAIWDVPFARHLSGAAKRILDGWEFAPILTARTGAPYSIYDLTNDDNVYTRVILNQSLPLEGNAGRQAIGPNTYNVWDFTNVSVNDNWVNPITGDADFGPWPAGMTGRDIFRNFGTWNLDMGLYKNVNITERMSLQLRLEAYNAFNHANFGTDIGSAYVLPPYGYNTITGGYSGNRNVQLGAKLKF